MKPKTLVFLMVLLVACVAALIVSKSDLFTKPSDEDGEDDKLVLSAGEVKGLTLTPRDGEKMVFAREGDDWRIVQPVRAKAENFKVDGIVRALREMNYERAFSKGDAEADTEITGLDKPLWTLVIEDDAGNSHTVLVGKRVPLGRRNETFIRIEDDERTFIVAEDFADRLRGGPGEFRDKTIIDVSKDDIEQVIVSGSENYELARGKDGKWGVVQPFSARADEEEVLKLIDGLATVRVSDFVEDAPKDLSRYGLDKPRLVVRFRLKADSPETAPATGPASEPATRPAGKEYAIEIGNVSGRSKKAFAKLADQPSVFLVSDSLLEDLQPKLADLRDKNILRFDKDEVSRIVMQLPDGNCELVKDAGEWRMAAPYEGKAGEKAVRKLLDDLAALKAESFPAGASEGAYGLDKPRGRVTLHFAGKDETVSLLVGNLSQDHAFVKSAAAASVAMVLADQVKPVLSAPANYWSPVLMEPDADAEPTRLKLTRPDGTYVLARDEEGKWMLTKPLQAEADSESVDEILDSLEKLEAGKVVALGAEAPKKYVEEKQRITVELTVEEEPPPPLAQTKPAATSSAPATAPATGPASAPSTLPATTPASRPVARTYTVQAVKLDENTYAWLEAGVIVAVGEFSESLYDKLAAGLRSTKLLTLDADDVDRIRITAGDDRTELLREGDAWKYPAGPSVKIDTSKVSDFLVHLRDLNAEEFVSHASVEPDKYGLDKPELTVELVRTKGEPVRLAVSALKHEDTLSRYATISGVQGVFLLSADSVAGCRKTLPDFRKE